MKIVEFILQSPPYNAGETAGFEDATALDLVRRGAARLVDEVEGPAPADTPIVAPSTDNTVTMLQPGEDTTGSLADTMPGPAEEQHATALADAFEAMSDDELREFIKDRDGRRPNANASRETLLEKARQGEPETASAPTAPLDTPSNSDAALAPDVSE